MKIWLLMLSLLASACTSSSPSRDMMPTPSTSTHDGSAPRPSAKAPDSSSPLTPPAAISPSRSLVKTPDSSGGGYYLDDGPPADFDWRTIPDAVPRWEPIHLAATKPYTALGKRYVPRQTLVPYREQGQASWYGKRYHGRLTATGEIYDMRQMTASHPTLPLPSYVRVTRLQNGQPTDKSVIVRLNDRGPFFAGRIIDLSYTAAAKLDIVSVGVGEVLIESIMVPRPADLPDATIYIQLGAFTHAANATQLAEKIKTLGVTATVQQSKGLYFTLAGPYPQQTTAAEQQQILCAAGHCGFLRARLP